MAVQSSYVRLYVNDVQTIAYSAGVQYNYINGNVAKTLTATGLGIGTTAPEDKLDIVGNLRICSSKTANTNKTNRIRGEHYDIAEEPHTFMFMNSFSNHSTLHIGGGSTVENAATSLKFYTAANNTTTAGTLALTIDSSQNATFAGNIILPDANPSNNVGTLKLGTGGDLQIYHNGSHSYIDETGTGNLYIRNGTKNSIWCQTDGAVQLYYNDSKQLETTSQGIKITTPSSNSIGNGIVIDRPSAGTHYHALEFSTAGTCDWSIGQNAANALEIYENGSDATTRLTILEGGNVGIGTTNPSVKLEIQTATSNTTSVEGLRLHNAGGGIGAGVKIGLGVGTTYSEKAYLRTDIINGGAGRLFIGVNGSDRVLIDNAGNVGIGTTSPASKLQVSTTNAANILTLHRDGSNNGTNTTLNRIQFAQDYNSTQQNWGKIDLDSNSSPYRTDLKFYVKSTSGLEMLGMTVHGTASDGPRVGIGTTSPSTKLDVNGITTSDAFRTDTSNTDYNVISRNSTSTTLWVQAAQSNSIQGIASFRYGSATVNAGTEVCAIRKNSSYFINTKLGVGTNNPATTLDVEGTIKHKVYTVSTLPSASPAGQRAFISDNYYNLQESHGMGVYSGGSNFVPVYSDGTNWRVG